MGRERLYIWILAIIGGLIFIVSNLFWLLPFIEDVEAAAERYQFEVARRVVSQAQFFIENKLRAMSLLAADIVEADLLKKKVELIEKKFLEQQPDFLDIKLVPSSLALDEYFLSPVLEAEGEKVAVLKIPVAGSNFDLEGLVLLKEIIGAAQYERVGELGKVLISDNQGNVIFGSRLDLALGEVASVTVEVPNVGWLVTVEDPVVEAWANKYRAINLAVILMLIGLIFMVILVVNYQKLLGIALREKQLGKAKSEYISLMTHQLRTPLAAAKWNLKTLLDGDWGPLTKKQKKFLERGYESNEEMIGLVDNLLQITRIEEGRFGYKFVRSDLLKILEKTVNSFRPVAKQAKVVLFFRRPKAKIPSLSVDPEKMTMAISNLIDNAVRYNKPQGKVEVGAARWNREVRVWVKDTGAGIPANQIHKLFSKFFRAENILRQQVQGFGLGLYIVKNIIERHGGRIEVESKEGAGSTFTVILPIK